MNSKLFALSVFVAGLGSSLILPDMRATGAATGARPKAAVSSIAGTATVSGKVQAAKDFKGRRSI